MIVGKRGKSSAVIGIHRELGRVELGGAEYHFAFELLARLVQVPLCKTDKSEQPVQSLRRVALAQVCLAVLQDGPFPEHRLGTVESAACDVHHCRLEVRERKLRI